MNHYMATKSREFLCSPSVSCSCTIADEDGQVSWERMQHVEPFHVIDLSGSAKPELLAKMQIDHRVLVPNFTPGGNKLLKVRFVWYR